MNENEVSNEINSEPAGMVRWFALLALLFSLFALIIIPFKITAYGYLPQDDALRHSAFAMTNHQSWNEVLVSDRPIPDIHAGWHATLRMVKNAFSLNTDGVVTFSVVSLFLLWAIPPLFMLKRPESWVLALLLSALILDLGVRSLYGRPFLLQAAVLVWILLLYEPLNEKKTPWGLLLFLMGSMAVSIWWRSTWFLYAIPLASLFLARKWRAFFRTGVALGVATVLVTVLTGNFRLPLDSLILAEWVKHSVQYTTQFVAEMQPATSFGSIFFSLAALILFVKFTGGNLRKMLDSPAFYLLLMTIILSSQAIKWWAEFGAPAWVALLALEIDRFLERKEEEIPFFSAPRLLVAALAACCLFFVYSADVGGRWTNALHNEYIDLSDPEVQQGLPGEDGIVYNDDMRIFYQTMYSHPDAHWRYVLGFESALMAPDDLKILRNIQWNRGAFKAYDPWVEKMRPQDRLWISQGMGSPHPAIDSLEWTRLTSYLWSGRLKEKDPVSSSTDK